MWITAPALMQFVAQKVQDEQCGTDEDRAIGQVEDGPPTHLNEVNHIPKTNPIDDVAEGPTHNQPHNQLDVWTLIGHLCDVEVDRHRDNEQRHAEKQFGVTLKEAEGDTGIVRVGEAYIATYQIDEVGHCLRAKGTHNPELATLVEEDRYSGNTRWR